MDGILFSMLLLASLPVFGMQNGQRISSTVFPWVAALIEIRTWRAKCSGAVISSHFVLTASSCFLKNGTLDHINSKNYAVVLPTSQANQVREIDKLLFPTPTVFDYETGALISVKDRFDMGKGQAAALPIWSRDKNRLGPEFNYIFNNAGDIPCTVVVWRHEIPRTSRDDLDEQYEVPPYDVTVVNMADAVIYNPAACRSIWCKTYDPVECDILLNRSMCVKILEPEAAHVCGSDEGAALSCLDFHWGLLIGVTACPKQSANNQASQHYPLFYRTDFALDVILANENLYPPDPAEPINLSSSPKPSFFGIQYIVLLMKFYISMLFPLVNPHITVVC